MSGEGGHADGADQHGSEETSVTSLVGPDGPADMSVTLTARAETIRLGGAQERAAWRASR